MTCLISMKECCRRINKSRSWVYDKLNDGEFPQPVQVSERHIGFIEDELDAWIAARPRANLRVATAHVAAVA